MFALIFHHVAKIKQAGQPTGISATACSVPCRTMTAWSNMHVLHLGPQPGQQWCAHYVCYATVLLFSLKLLGHGLVCALPLRFPSPTPPPYPPPHVAESLYIPLLSALAGLCVRVQSQLVMKTRKIIQISFTLRDFTRVMMRTCNPSLSSHPTPPVEMDKELHSEEMITLQPWRYIKKKQQQHSELAFPSSFVPFWTSTSFVHQVAAHISRAVTRFTTPIIASLRSAFHSSPVAHYRPLLPPPGRTWRSPGTSSCTKGRSHWAFPSSAGRTEASLSPK